MRARRRRRRGEMEGEERGLERWSGSGGVVGIYTPGKAAAGDVAVGGSGGGGERWGERQRLVWWVGSGERGA